MGDNRPVELSDEDFASVIGQERECLVVLKAPRRMWNTIIPMEAHYTLGCCSSVSRVCVVQLCRRAERWPGQP